MTKYSVYWTEYHSVIVEATSEAEALQKIADCQYDKEKEDVELDSDVEAMPL